MRRILGGLLKYSLLLLAAAPLLSIGWGEVARLGQAATLRLKAPYPDDAEQALQKLQAAPKSELLRNANLAAAVAGIQPNVSLGIAGLGLAEQRLAPAVEKHSQTVGDTWKLVKAYGDLQRNAALPGTPPFPESHPYYAVWRERYVVVELESRIDTIRTNRPQDVEESRTLLSQYRALPGHDPEFHLLKLADTEGHELREIQTLDLQMALAKYLQDPEAATVVLDVRNQLQKRLESLETYVARYTEPAFYVQWATQEAARCRVARDLINTDQTGRDQPLDRRLAEFARFLTEEGATAATAQVVRETVHALCAARLAAEVPLDNALHVLRHEGDSDDQSLVPRSDVIVVWQDRTFQWLTESGFDEYTLPVDKVHRIIINKRGTRPPLLKPTQASSAAHCYTENRRKLQWTPQSLRALKVACQPHQAELGDLWQRLVELDGLAAQHGVLFPEANPTEDPQKPIPSQ